MHERRYIAATRKRQGVLRQAGRKRRDKHVLRSTMTRTSRTQQHERRRVLQAHWACTLAPLGQRMERSGGQKRGRGSWIRCSRGGDAPTPVKIHFGELMNEYCAQDTMQTECFHTRKIHENDDCNSEAMSTEALWERPLVVRARAYRRAVTRCSRELWCTHCWKGAPRTTREGKGRGRLLETFGFSEGGRTGGVETPELLNEAAEQASALHRKLLSSSPAQTHPNSSTCQPRPPQQCVGSRTPVISRSLPAYAQRPEIPAQRRRCRAWQSTPRVPLCDVSVWLPRGTHLLHGNHLTGGRLGTTDSEEGADPWADPETSDAETTATATGPPFDGPRTPRPRALLFLARPFLSSGLGNPFGFFSGLLCRL